MPTFFALFERFPAVLAGAYRSGRWRWHVAAVGITALLVLSGADWAYFGATRAIAHAGIAAAILGFYVPILVPIILYTIGVRRRSDALRRAGIAVAQAAAAGLVISSFYKVFTGRMQPEFYTVTSTIDTSREFLFGVYRHGIFWGWPSSHVAVAVASTLALVLLFPTSRFVRYAALAYMVFIVIGVSVSIHWLSDALAGALIGIAIAYAATDRYRATPPERR